MAESTRAVPNVPEQAVAIGSKLAGASTAAVFEHAGIPGGFAAAVFVSATVDDVLHRLLSGRQKHRVISLSEYASASYSEFLADGAKLRSDDFFDKRDGRWSSNEVVEAVLLSAANEPSELKLKFLGHMLAVFAIDDSIDVPSAHWLLHEAEDLSWQQYVQLALVGRIEDLKTPAVKVGGGGWSSWRGFSSVMQFVDLGLYERNLVAGTVTEESKGKLLPIHSLDLQDQRLTTQGNALYQVLGLEGIAADAIEDELSVWRTIATQQARGD